MIVATVTKMVAQKPCAFIAPYGDWQNMLYIENKEKKSCSRTGSSRKKRCTPCRLLLLYLLCDFGAVFQFIMVYQVPPFLFLLIGDMGPYRDLLNFPSPCTMKVCSSTTSTDHAPRNLQLVNNLQTSIYKPETIS